MSASEPPPAAPSAACVKRLQQEFREIVTSPPDNVIAAPDPEDILTWYYCLLGGEDTPYESGCYFGTLTFPPSYPHKPPAIRMITPNGRFKTDTRLCLSMSDFHPEAWSVSWSVSTILIGLLSFMLEEATTYGSIPGTAAERKDFAERSLEFNKSLPKFREMFPQLCE